MCDWGVGSWVGLRWQRPPRAWLSAPHPHPEMLRWGLCHSLVSRGDQALAAPWGVPHGSGEHGSPLLGVGPWGGNFWELPCGCWGLTIALMPHSRFPHLPPCTVLHMQSRA